MLRIATPLLLVALPLLPMSPGAVQDGDGPKTAAELAPGGFRVERDDRNVLSGRLAGEWVPDQDWNSDLGSKREGSFVFEADPEVARELPEMYREMLKQSPIYESGVVRFKRAGSVESRQPYLLLAMAGNQYLVTFRNRDGQRFADAEAGLVQIVIGKEAHQDRLILGGDFANEPFSAWTRVPQ